MGRPFRGLLHALLWVVIAVCIATLSTRFSFSVDWSAGARATITPQSRAILAKLNGPLVVTSYARPGRLRARTRLLMQRYHRFKPDLALQFVDPDRDPVATQDAHVTAEGQLVLAWKGRQQQVVQLDEQHLTDALVRLARGGAPLVAFVTGNGERDIADSGPAGLGNLVTQLSARGLRPVPLNLAEVAQVPRNASLVVLASPQAVLPPESVRKLTDYLATGGNLLWLSEPGSGDLGLAPLAGTLGIRRLRGLVVDGTASGDRDPRVIVATHYPPQAITDGFRINARFPRVTALAALTGAPWNIQPMLESGAQSWNQTRHPNPSRPFVARFNADAGELKGPLTFGYALSRVSPSPAKSQQRAVVIGDGDFLSDAFLGDGGNLALGERIFDWLLGDEVLLGQPQAAPDIVLTPTRTQLLLATFGYLLALPIALILGGAMIGWRRRRR